MLGIFIGLLSASTEGVRGAIQKKLSALNPYALTFVSVAASLPVLALLITIFGLWAIPPKTFWFILALFVPIEIFLQYIGVLMLRYAPLSVAGPLRAFTSIFLIPIAFIMLGEVPSLLGVLGIIIIVCGSLFLQPGMFTSRELRARILTDRGVLLALLSAFLAAVTTGILKLTFSYASPLLASFYVDAVTAVVLIPLFVRHRHMSAVAPRTLAALALTSGAGVTFHTLGLSLLPAAYFVAIKRLSMVISVILGRAFFKEEHFRERMIGSLLMTVGVILLSLGL